MGTIDDMKSFLTQSGLDALCEKFHIPRTVHPELPGRNHRIRNSPTGKIGVYTRFFDFANYRIPLSQFLVDILEYFHINLSQLSVIAAAKVSHFKILCRVHSFVATVGNFRTFYINSKNKGWMSFSKRSDTGPVCYTKPLDSLKHWNDNFFWVDASAFLLSIPWHNNKTLKKDHPTPNDFNAEVCDFLATHPAPFQKFSESFLCLVGISRYYELDNNVYPMDLFAFINHVDPTKVRIGEREVREGEVLLLESTRGRVVSLAGVNEQANQNDDIQDDGVHVVNKEGAADGQENLVDAGIVRIEDKVPTTVAEKAKGSRKKRKAARGASGSNLPPKKLRAYHGTSGVGASTGGKFVVVLQGLLERSALPVEVGVTVVATLPFITSSVSLTPEHEGGGGTDSVTGSNQRTQHPAKRSLVLDPPIITTVVASTVVVVASFVLVPRAGDEPVYASIFADSTSVGTDMDSETLRPIYIPKWNVVNESALDDPDFNVGAARQTCLGAEVRIRTEHILIEKRKLEGRCSRQADLLKERDVEIAARVAELNSLKERTTALEGQVSGYELFKEQYEAVQDKQVKVLSDKVVGLDAELMGMALHLDEEFYPRFLTTIVRRRWILGRGLRLVVIKCLQSLEYFATLGGAIGGAINKDYLNHGLGFVIVAIRKKLVVVVVLVGIVETVPASSTRRRLEIPSVPGHINVRLILEIDQSLSMDVETGGIRRDTIEWHALVLIWRVRCCALEGRADAQIVREEGAGINGGELLLVSRRMVVACVVARGRELLATVGGCRFYGWRLLLREIARVECCLDSVSMYDCLYTQSPLLQNAARSDASSAHFRRHNENLLMKELLLPF
ncbi:hypothetical protein Tco_0939103 [Tanacetum coccineum]|uniref:Transposase (Putative), gypsy type n=1 Tax=Tanacetum coccineum TaxID=301880 RepID=A0ABQ5DLS6_9ASTR